jgi:hypothetical protein
VSDIASNSCQSFRNPQFLHDFCISAAIFSSIITALDVSLANEDAGMKQHRLKVTLTLVAFALVTANNQVVANEGREGRRGPPPEAIASCANLSAGDACKFTGRRDEQLNGVCFAPPEPRLACRPHGHEDRNRRRDRDQGEPSEESRDR